jgi:MFS family permease
MFLTPSMGNLYVLVFIAMCIGMNYGSNLALFPAVTKESFGLKNFGINYGLVFTAWGVGSLMALVAGRIYDWSKAATGVGRFDYALYMSGAMLVITLVLSLVVGPMLVKIKET